jgi:phosphotriesterase-related protein
MTVRGPVDPEAVGITLMHEHILVDWSDLVEPPEEATLRSVWATPVTMDKLFFLRRGKMSLIRENLILDDESLAVEEVERFAREGGDTIVELTSLGVRRDPRALRRISQAAGVHIVMGGGVYVGSAHPEWVRDATVDALADFFTREVFAGVADTGVRCGIIGEIGTSGVEGPPSGAKQGHITQGEEKVLRAAAQASLRTRLSVSVHLDPRGKGAFTVLDILESEGVPVDRIVLSHLDIVHDHDLDYIREVAKRGAVVEFDCFGREYYGMVGEDYFFGSDAWRVESVAKLVSEGYEDQIVISQDLALKIDLHRYGGQGYDHILVNVVPMLRRAGVSDAVLTKILVENPRRILTADWDEEVIEGIKSDVRNHVRATSTVAVH